MAAASPLTVAVEFGVALRGESAAALNSSVTARKLSLIGRKFAANINCRVVAATHYSFNKMGASAALILAESHIVLHTYPEHKLVTVSLHVCGAEQLEMADNPETLRSALEVACTRLIPQQVVKVSVVGVTRTVLENI